MLDQNPPGEAAAPDVAARFDLDLRCLLESQTPQEFDFEMAAPAGRRSFRARLVPERDLGGAVVSLQCRMRDVSDSRMLDLLKAALARLPAGRALVEAPSGAVLFRNDEAMIIFRRDPTLPTVRGVNEYGVYTGFKADGSPYAPEEWRRHYPALGDGADLGEGAWAAVTLRVGQGRQLGAVWLAFSEPRDFTESDVEILSTIAAGGDGRALPAEHRHQPGAGAAGGLRGRARRHARRPGRAAGLGADLRRGRGHALPGLARSLDGAQPG
ncbi:MAG TPA: PAS domain-containing protein, partial [Vicinamibacteria bacterium]|nr:PAS domain-containing protein [Vicinamibacteria bacterium]